MEFLKDAKKDKLHADSVCLNLFMDITGNAKNMINKINKERRRSMNATPI
jgi:Mg2+ and Co2+ transporter CorA